MKKLSKDFKANLFFGKRMEGKPHMTVFFPEELGFVCPICGLGNKFSDGELKWSEYNSFIWCPNCNIDIPSCMCVKYSEQKIGQKPLTKRQRIKRAKEIFYKTCESLLKQKKKLEDSNQLKQGVSRGRKDVKKV